MERITGDLDLEVQDLVSRLTVDEKISLLAGKTTWETTPIERLNIPSLKVSVSPFSKPCVEYILLTSNRYLMDQMAREAQTSLMV